MRSAIAILFGIVMAGTGLLLCLWMIFTVPNRLGWIIGAATWAALGIYVILDEVRFNNRPRRR